MSTIPTIFNETIPSYTVVGGRERLGSTGLSAVLLNRAGRYARRSLFHELKKTGFDTVISIEPAPALYDIDDLCARFPFVRFIILREKISLGEQINIAASEVDTPLFFVLWNDLKIIAGGTARRMAERLSSPLENGEKEKEYKRLCTVPLIQNSHFETIPTLMAPTLRRKKIKTMFLDPLSEGLPSLYPFDGVGIYNRDRFIRMIGFDSTIKNRFWQLMDFGFRAWLWGEEITATRTLKLSYETAVPSEDNSVNADYYRFYLKNLAPAFRLDHAFLPLRRFPGFMLRACSIRGDGGFSAARENFQESRLWVKTNSLRWCYSPETVADRWNINTARENNFPENGE